MSPPRKGRKLPEKNAKDTKAKSLKGKEEPVEPPQVVLTPGAGWTTDNFAYLKTIPAENQISQLYAMFGIPPEFEHDKTKTAVQVFIEFNYSSFRFAQQFQDVMKAMSVIAILSDYITSVPAYPNAKECFSTWIEKATNQVNSLDFTPGEAQVVLQYLNKNVRENAHIHSFVLTKESVEVAEKAGVNLFRTKLVDPSELTEEEKRLAAQRQSEFEAQQRLLEQAMKEKKEAEEKQRQEELAAAIQNIVSENFAKITATLEQRNEAIIQQIIALEEKIDGPVKGRR